MAKHWDHWEAHRFIAYGDPSAEIAEQWRDRELRRRGIDQQDTEAEQKVADEEYRAFVESYATLEGFARDRLITVTGKRLNSSARKRIPKKFWIDGKINHTEDFARPTRVDEDEIYLPDLRPDLERGSWYELRFDPNEVEAAKAAQNTSAEHDNFSLLPDANIGVTQGHTEETDQGKHKKPKLGPKFGPYYTILEEYVRKLQDLLGEGFHEEIKEMRRSEIAQKFGSALKRDTRVKKPPADSTLENAVRNIAAKLPTKSSSGGNSTP